MNRIILIGNGFDLAHGLKTSYANFIDWYWNEWGKRLKSSKTTIEEDRFCSIKLKEEGPLFILPTINEITDNIVDKLKVYGAKFKYNIDKLVDDNPNLKSFTIKSPFFKEICRLSKNGWVDIEKEFYNFLNSDSEVKQINDDLDFIKDNLIKYLLGVQKSISKDLVKEDLKKKIKEPFKQKDIAVSSMAHWVDIEMQFYLTRKSPIIPKKVLLLNFNYTTLADLYMPTTKRNFLINHIHGKLSEPNSIIFGYGDELDENYKRLSEKNDNEYLRNIKSIKYLEATNYHSLLEFIESDAYQIYIMGHSCGNSDRTLLNTLFEHKNCVSIKPFYFIRKDGTDNYMELVQNISRNFTDMKLMRDRVVNKTFCEPYSDAREKISYCADTPEGAKLPLP